MRHYQNLAYCRFLHIWMVFYFLNLFYYSPVFSFYITFLVHVSNVYNKTSLSKNKMIGLIGSDIIIIVLLNMKSPQLHIFDSIMIFMYYNFFLRVYNYMYNDTINVCNLHFEKLKHDDDKNKEETYLQYIVRVWSYILIPPNFNFI